MQFNDVYAGLSTASGWNLSMFSEDDIQRIHEATLYVLEKTRVQVLYDKALDVIANVGIGGHYMVEGHTLEHFKQETIDADLFTRENYDGWLTGGKREIKDIATGKVKNVLETHEVAPLPEGIEKEFNAIIKSLED